MCCGGVQWAGPRGRGRALSSGTGNALHLAAIHLGLSWPNLTARHLRADQGNRPSGGPGPPDPLPSSASLHPFPSSRVHFRVLQGPGLWAHRCQEPQPRVLTALALMENTPEKYLETYVQGSLFLFPNGAQDPQNQRCKGLPRRAQSPSSGMALPKQFACQGHPPTPPARFPSFFTI